MAIARHKTRCVLSRRLRYTSSQKQSRRDRMERRHWLVPKLSHTNRIRHCIVQVVTRRLYFLCTNSSICLTHVTVSFCHVDVRISKAHGSSKRLPSKGPTTHAPRRSVILLWSKRRWLEERALGVEAWQLVWLADCVVRVRVTEWRCSTL